MAGTLAADVVAFALADVGGVARVDALAVFDRALDAAVDLAGVAVISLALEAALVAAASADLERE